jgi:hypothetical protein
MFALLTNCVKFGGIIKKVCIQHTLLSQIFQWNPKLILVLGWSDKHLTMQCWS